MYVLIYDKWLKLVALKGYVELYTSDSVMYRLSCMSKVISDTKLYIYIYIYSCYGCSECGRSK